MSDKAQARSARREASIFDFVDRVVGRTLADSDGKRKGDDMVAGDVSAAIAKRRAAESAPVDFLSAIVSPEQLERVREPAEGAPKPRQAVPPGQLDYGDTRPELTNTRIENSGVSSRGTSMDRPETPRGSEATLDYSASRPELQEPSFIETMRARNSRTLEQCRADYIKEWSEWHDGKRSERPTFNANAAVDFSEMLRKHGPSVGLPPEIDMLKPRANV